MINRHCGKMYRKKIKGPEYDMPFYFVLFFYNRLIIYNILAYCSNFSSMNESIEHYFEQYPKINHAKIVIHFTFHITCSSQENYFQSIENWNEIYCNFFFLFFSKKKRIINCFYIKNEKSLIC